MYKNLTKEKLEEVIDLIEKDSENKKELIFYSSKEGVRQFREAFFKYIREMKKPE